MVLTVQIVLNVLGAITDRTCAGRNCGRLGERSLAWGSHVLLDWLSNDTRPPLGIMALWPLTREYYKASIEIFLPVSRRYWESRFWIYNLRALIVELAVMGPIAALVVWAARRRRGQNPGSDPGVRPRGLTPQ